MQQFEPNIEFYRNFKFKLYLSSKMRNILNWNEPNLYKSPAIIDDGTQSIKYYRQANEGVVTGIGVFLGVENLMAIDIDGIFDKVFLNNVLLILNLPSDYQWIVKSGSKCGYHIIFYSELKSEHKEILNSKSSYYSKYSKRPFSKMEFLIEGNLQLPPSLHESGGIYSFVNDVPHNSPKLVDPDRLFFLRRTYCGQQAYASRVGNNPEDIHKIYFNAYPDKTGNLILKNTMRANSSLIIQYSAGIITDLFGKIKKNKYVIYLSVIMCDVNFNILSKRLYSYISNELPEGIQVYASFKFSDIESELIPLQKIYNEILGLFLFHSQIVILYNKQQVEYYKKCLIEFSFFNNVKLYYKQFYTFIATENYGEFDDLYEQIIKMRISKIDELEFKKFAESSIKENGYNPWIIAMCFYFFYLKNKLHELRVHFGGWGEQVIINDSPLSNDELLNICKRQNNDFSYYLND